MQLSLNLVSCYCVELKGRCVGILELTLPFVSFSHNCGMSCDNSLKFQAAAISCNQQYVNPLRLLIIWFRARFTNLLPPLNDVLCSYSNKHKINTDYYERYGASCFYCTTYIVLRQRFDYIVVLKFRLYYEHCNSFIVLMGSFQLLMEHIGLELYFRQFNAFNVINKNVFLSHLEKYVTGYLFQDYQ